MRLQNKHINKTRFIYHLISNVRLQKSRDPNMLDKATLEKYLESDDKIFVARVRKYFGGKRSWCFQFKYSALGIDLIRKENARDLKAKYAEMGVVCEEEDLMEEKTNLFF